MEEMMKRLVVLAIVFVVAVPCHVAQGGEHLLVDLERSYVLETETSAIVTLHGDRWVLQAEFPRDSVFEDSQLVRKVTLRPGKARLHLGPHVHIAFRVPAGPPLPPDYRDHASYEVTHIQVRFIPPTDSQKRELLMVITPFVANGETYEIKAPARDEDPIPLRITVPLP
jgi:hypothetical protein